jgi:hypothetical protein
MRQVTALSPVIPKFHWEKTTHPFTHSTASQLTLTPRVGSRQRSDISAAAISYQQHLDASALTAQRLETMHAELFAAQRTVGEQLRQSARQAAARLAEVHGELRTAVCEKEATQAELQQVRLPHCRARCAPALPPRSPKAR